MKKGLISLKEWCTKNNSNLLDEWDYEYNTIDPNEVGFKSHYKVQWKCLKGHKWITSISTRVSGNRNCLYCTHQKVIKGETDLETLNPDLCKEWDYEKNGNLKPSDVFPGSKKKVWWICEKNHSWFAQIKSRNNGVGCPYCSGKKVLKGFNDLETRYPEIAKEWDYECNGDLKPSDVTFGSGRKVGWVCPNKHHYKSVICNRTKNRGCPICARSLRTSFPEQSIFYYVKKYFPDSISGYRDIFPYTMELDVFIPSLNIGIEYDGKTYHSNSNIKMRDQKKYKICKENGILLFRIIEFQDRPNLLTNCDYKIEIPDARSEYLNYAINNLIYHLISINNSRLNLPNTRTIIGKDENPIDVDRDRKKIESLLGKRKVNLLTEYPEIAKEWDYKKNYPLIPENFSPHSNRKVGWICQKCKNPWDASIGDRTRKDSTGCPVCNKHRYKKVMCIETGKTYDSSLIASKDINGTPNMINEVCRGNKKSYKGLHWKYVE